MLIQAYGWPGILKLNHVVGISPVQTGKTFTYLCPLLSELLNPQSYQELAIGNGVCKDIVSVIIVAIVIVQMLVIFVFNVHSWNQIQF